MTAIKIENLTKYYGATRGIEALNLSVGQGTVFGYIGPNGAGKSTTIKLLLDFIKPTSGTAQIFGMDCRKKNVQIKRDVGYLPAEVSYYDHMKVSTLLDYSASFYGKNLKSRTKKLCDRLDLDVSRKIEELSLGNRKKVAIVQAMMHNPRLLIMDEPSSGLDPLVKAAFYELLNQEKEEGTTIFFSSHILSEVEKVCSKVGIIKDGALIKTENIQTLNGTKHKKIKIIFKEPPRGEISIDGAKDTSLKNNQMELIYGSSIQRLISELNKYEIEDIWIGDPTLEEIFINFYSKEKEEIS